ATPVEPDLEQLLKTPTPTHQFTPARAGWNGPENAGPGDAVDVTALERYSPEASALALRHELQRLAIPDWRFVAFLALLIVALRVVRQRGEQRPSMPAQPSDRFIPEPEPEALPEELNPAA
ncbi:MAG TPA: hypothetical protein VF786_06830, partial [Terriglobales bacterium]